MDIQALTQVPAECMCDAGAERDVWSKKKRAGPGRRAVPLGGPLRLDHNNTGSFSEESLSARRISQIVGDLGRRNPSRA